MASAPLNWLLKIGGDALTTTAQTISAAVNELKSGIGAVESSISNLAGDDIAYDNTVSQFTATNVQDAIDEIDGMIGDVESLLAAL